MTLYSLFKRTSQSRWLARSTVFCAFFAIAATVGWFRGLMTGTEYVALVSTVTAAITGRAVAADYHERNKLAADPAKG